MTGGNHSLKPQKASGAIDEQNLQKAVEAILESEFLQQISENVQIFQPIRLHCTIG